MAVTTHYIVQSFFLQGKKLVADQPRKMQDAQSAIEGAQRLAERKAGVVALAVEVEAEADVPADDPKILFRAGTLPRELAGD